MPAQAVRTTLGLRRGPQPARASFPSGGRSGRRPDSRAWLACPGRRSVTATTGTAAPGGSDDPGAEGSRTWATTSQARQYTREDRKRYREKVRAVPGRLRADAGRAHLRVRPAAHRAGDRAQPGRRQLAIRRWTTPQCWRTSPTRPIRPNSGSTTSSSTSTRRRCPATPCSSSRPSLRASLDHAETKANELGAEIVMVGILPTLMPEHLSADWMSANPRYAALNEAIFAARREDLELDIHGAAETSCTWTPTPSRPESACTSVQLHLQVSPADFAAELERRAGAGRPAAGAGRELAVPVRQAAVGRDPHRAVPAGHRHPLAGAAQPGGASAGVLRRTVDHLDLRPLRGERPLLPRAAAGDHRRGPGGRAGLRTRAPSCRSCGCTTAPSTAGTARCTTSSTASRTCGWRTGCCRPGRPWSTCWPTPRSTTARSGCWPPRSGRSGRR